MLGVADVPASDGRWFQQGGAPQFSPRSVNQPRSTVSSHHEGEARRNWYADLLVEWLSSCTAASSEETTLVLRDHIVMDAGSSQQAKPSS